MNRIAIISCVLFGVLACSKGEPRETTAGKTDPAADQSAEPVQPAEPAAEDAEEAERKRVQAERIAQARKDDMEQLAKERERWTDELRAQATQLVEGDYKDARSMLEAIVASPHRVPAHTERDAYRHPVETLHFFGIQPGMTVIEVGAGRGWYSEILAPFLARQGKLVIATGNPDGPPDAYATLAGMRVQGFVAKSAEIFGKVETTIVAPPETLRLGEPGSADMVVAFRELHNWYRGGFMTQYLEEIHAVLKPGGVLGLVAHRGKEGEDADEAVQRGYLPEAWVIEQVEAAGFKLEERSDINANAQDTKDYEQGVWALPPNLRVSDEEREKHMAIGESDRMTLKFVKAE